MSWEFTEDAAFLALCDAFKESGETSAMEFLANGEGAFHFQELSQNAAGEGIDLSDSTDLEEFQQEVIDTMERICLKIQADLPCRWSSPRGIPKGLVENPVLDHGDRYLSVVLGALAMGPRRPF